MRYQIEGVLQERNFGEIWFAKTVSINVEAQSTEEAITKALYRKRTKDIFKWKKVKSIELKGR